MNYIPRSELVASKSHLLKCSKTSWYDRFPEWFASKVRGGLTKKIDGVEVPHPMLSGGRGDFNLHDTKTTLPFKLERAGIDVEKLNDNILSNFGDADVTDAALPKVPRAWWGLTRLSGAHKAPAEHARKYSLRENPANAILNSINILPQGVYNSLAGKLYDDRLAARDAIENQLKSKELGVSGVSPALVNLLEAATRRDILAGARGDNSGGLSAAGLIGHGLQAGGLVGAGLTMPYIIDRIKKHIKLQKEQDKQHKPQNTRRKKASIVADVSDFFSPLDTDPAHVFDPRKSHNRIAGSGMGTKPAYIASLALSYYLARKAMLSASNYASDKHLDHLEKEDRNLISNALTVKKKANTEGPVAPDSGNSQGDIGSPNIGLLLALWTALIPPFYSFGKRIGQDTSGAYRHNKFKEALRDMESRTSNAIRFNATPSGKLNTRPGAFFGETVVDLPTQQIAEKNKKEEDNDLLDESIFT